MSTSPSKRRSPARKTPASGPASGPASAPVASPAEATQATAPQPVTDVPPSEAASPEPAKAPRQRRAAGPAAQAEKSAATVAKPAKSAKPAKQARAAALVTEAAEPPPSAPMSVETPAEAAPARKRPSRKKPAQAPAVDTPLPAAQTAAPDAEAAPPKPARIRSRSAKSMQPAPVLADGEAELPVPEPAAPVEPPRYALGSREEEGVFGDYELHDQIDGSTLRLRLLGPQAWRCDCADYVAQGHCAHGAALQALLPSEAQAQLAAGWPAREAEVWLLPGAERRLQWVAGQGVPAAWQALPGLDERGSLPAEQAQDWLQQRLMEARAQGVLLRVDAQVWPQLAWARDAQARVQRLERAMGEGAGLAALLRDALPAYQWEAALFAVCAGRALLADDLGLGQRAAAVAALQLWRQLFAVSPAMIVAPASEHAAWQRELQRWLGELPNGVLLVAPDQVTAPRMSPALLVVDGVEALSGEQLQTLRTLEVPQLLLIARREPLGEAMLADWVDWLDPARRGPLARLQALGEGASKKQQREALQSVLLSRRRRELESTLPASLLQPLWLEAAGANLPQAPLKQLRQWMQRWQQLGYLSSAEQQQLLQALALLPPASRQVLAAKAEALLQLRRDWLESATPAASRLLVVARSETLLDSLALSPQLRRLPLQRLRAGDEAAQRQALLQAWRAAPAGLLLASDDALASLDEAALAQDGLALVHADLPWQGERLAQRLTQACGAAVRGLPCALLLVSGSLDEVLLKAQRAGQALPAWLDQSPLWLEPEQLQALMAALSAAWPELLSS